MPKSSIIEPDQQKFDTLATLALNLRMWTQAARGKNGYRFLDQKMQAEIDMDLWLKNNIQDMAELATNL